MMRRFAPAWAFLLAALALLGAAAPSAAKPTDAQLEAIKANCRSDFMSNCWGVPRGGVEAMQCLKEHMSSLSPGCQTAVKAIAPPAPPPAPTTADKKPESAPPEPAPAPAATAEPAAAAAPETPPPAQDAAAEPSAPAVKTGAPATAKASGEDTAAKAPIAAPAEPAADDAPAIIGFIPPRKKLMVQRNCRQDLATYCADVDLGDGRVLRCLLNNQAALTPDCQGALAKLSH
jgi:hypothetical protein